MIRFGKAKVSIDPSESYILPVADYYDLSFEHDAYEEDSEGETFYCGSCGKHLPISEYPHACPAKGGARPWGA